VSGKDKKYKPASKAKTHLPGNIETSGYFLKVILR
jgi:hypothetical protein